MSREKRKLPFATPPLPFEAGDPLEGIVNIIEGIDRITGAIDDLVERLDSRLLNVPSMHTARLKPIEVPREAAAQLRSELDRTEAEGRRALGLIREGKLSEATKLLMDLAEKSNCPGCDAEIYRVALKTKLADLERKLKEGSWRVTARDAERSLSNFINKIPRIREAIRERD